MYTGPASETKQRFLVKIVLKWLEIKFLLNLFTFVCFISWFVLGEIFKALPYPIVLDSLNDEETKDALRHFAHPEMLDTLCQKLIEGSSVCIICLRFEGGDFKPAFHFCV